MQIAKIRQTPEPATPADNPRYAVSLSENSQPFYLFSKKYDDGQNPKKGFCAVLVCSSANGSCPLVAGASERVFHAYEDPKRADNSAEESKVYDQTCRLLAEIVEHFVLLRRAPGRDFSQKTACGLLEKPLGLRSTRNREGSSI